MKSYSPRAAKLVRDALKIRILGVQLVTIDKGVVSLDKFDHPGSTPYFSVRAIDPMEDNSYSTVKIITDGADFWRTVDYDNFMAEGIIIRDPKQAEEWKSVIRNAIKTFCGEQWPES